MPALLHALAHSARSREADRAARDARAAADIAALSAAAASVALATLRARLPDPSVDLADLRLAARLADRYEGLWAASEATALRAADAARTIRLAVDSLHPD